MVASAGWGCETAAPSCPDVAAPEDDGAGGDDAAADVAEDVWTCEVGEASPAFGEMYAGILERLLTEVPENEGDWAEDFGDATAFAPPALLTYGLATCDRELIGLAEETLVHQDFLVRHFLEVMGVGKETIP